MLERTIRRIMIEPEQASNSRTMVSVLDAIDQLSRLRGRYGEHKLDDVAWELLLELLRAERSEQRLSVSALTISVPGVSATTSLRRIGELQARGYVERTPDATDRRREVVARTPSARSLLADDLARVDTCLADIQRA
jgi:DNA-binding MarR family transcriptional regulator